jgi:hypothetical protein
MKLLFVTSTIFAAGDFCFGGVGTTVGAGGIILALYWAAGLFEILLGTGGDLTA